MLRQQLHSVIGRKTTKLKFPTPVKRNKEESSEDALHHVSPLLLDFLPGCYDDSDRQTPLHRPCCKSQTSQ